ncbi:SIR2 family protein [Nesterenkonia ebinurensis]|uniref:SIR2 family protein n=1 Tax=Nesterenkonia ebinurensis TaxID=2608252 RepID=UPI00168B6269|nr:SIR2 family protein [Nesterenkonia ebinurensis]
MTDDPSASPGPKASNRPTNRIFLLGAGFSKPARLPLADELLDQVLTVARSHWSINGSSHLERDLDHYEQYLADTEPGRPFDLEEFSAWLDWEHMLPLRGSDTFSDEGNQSTLQLRWAIGHVLHQATPKVLPEVYLEFARRLTTTDIVLTLNYDLVMERALTEVGLPYRRFPKRYSEVGNRSAIVDYQHPPELLLSKLHGSLDWVTKPLHPKTNIAVDTLVEGPRSSNDPLLALGVISALDLDAHYADDNGWWRSPPVLMAPSTAKPLARSSLVPLWEGILPWASTRGSFAVIGCSLPVGDPYVRRVAHHIATEIGASIDQGNELPWPQTTMKVVDYQTGRLGIHQIRERYRFMPTHHTDFILDGFSLDTLDQVVPPLH